MEITINDHRKIFAIEKEFNEMFPNLKLQFHTKPSKEGGRHPDETINSESKTLGDARNVHNKGFLSISPLMTVAELKESFNDVYGLSVGVLQKSGTEWIETRNNGKLTLEQQNKIG